MKHEVNGVIELKEIRGMDLEAIKTALAAGRKVYSKNLAYPVVKHNKQYLITCTLSAMCHGLTWQDGVTMNGKAEEFFSPAMRYVYDATVFSGDQSGCQDNVSDIRELLGDTVDCVSEELEDACYDDANERIHNPGVRDDETLEEGMARLAQVYHPEELKKMAIEELKLKNMEPKEMLHKLLYEILVLADNNASDLRAGGMPEASGDMLKITAYASKIQSLEFPDAKLISQTAVLFREAFTYAMWQDIYTVCCRDAEGFPGVAQLIADASLLHEKNLPDQGESFDWPESLENLASLIHSAVMYLDIWPDDSFIKGLSDTAIMVTKF